MILFLTASLIVILAPGPDNILVLTRGITQGRKAALVSAFGASVGLVCHSVFAAVGLSALLAQSAVAFSVVKYVGAAYLVYLGVKTLLSREGFELPEGETATVKLGSVFLQGVVSNVLNPKIAVFFLAFLPQFASQQAGGYRLLALGLTFALLTWILFTLLGYFSGSIGNKMMGRPVFYATALRWLTGGVLAALGLRLAIPERT